MAASTSKDSKASSNHEARSEGSKKSQEQAVEKQAAEAKAAEAKAKRDADAKAKREAKEAATEAREAKKAEKEELATKERQAQIDSGALIENGDTEFHLVVRDETPTVEGRAQEVLDRLQASDTPVNGSALRDELGGGWPQYLSFFAMLKSLGLVREYRSRTGERGGSGVAYLWISN